MDYKDHKLGQSKDFFWFKAKNDLIEKLLSKLPNKQLKILNIGAGTGDDIDILNKFGDVYVIDIEKNALDLIPNKKCAGKKVCDACNLKYPDKFFDVVTSFDVFEHINNDYKAISETYRVLKKGGSLISSVPAFQKLFSSHDKALGHVRRYSKSRIKKLLKDFKSHELNYWNSTLFFPLATMRIIKKNKKATIDNQNLPNLINNLFYKILKTENKLIQKGIKLPFGLSIISIAKK